MTDQLDWIPLGTRFTESDMVHFHGKGESELADVLADIDLIVTGPHATAAFPAELRPFVDTSLTRRLQYDFSDFSTHPVATRWAQLDLHTLYIHDPHPRAVRDANRARPADLAATVREAFDRLAAEPEGRASLAGVDAIRPVTFGYLPVLRRPQTDAEWTELGNVFTAACERGVDQYERVRDDIIERVIEAKVRRLAHLDPTRLTVRQRNIATSLNVLSIHDTMNHTARPDGAVCLGRAPADQLPAVVSLSNRGDADGDARIVETEGLRAEIDVPTMDPALLRTIGNAYRLALDAHEPDDVAYNRPYLGGYETQVAGPRLRALQPLTLVRNDDRRSRSLQLGAWQNEFLREFLLGPEATAHLMQPGGDWPEVPQARVQWLAERLTAAHDLVRDHGTMQ
jgi:hypothetical protein